MWPGNAGRIDCQVQGVSCIAELEPELTSLIRQHHQLNWYCKGLPTDRIPCLLDTLACAGCSPLPKYPVVLTQAEYLCGVADFPASWQLHAACEEALERGAGAWRAAMSSVDTELEKLRALLADYCIESTPQAELCILLTTGRASAALQQFLSSHLGVSRCALAACPGTEKACGMHL